jgi:hypothetical protein
MTKKDYQYFEKCRTDFVDISIDILSKCGRHEFFYAVLEADVKNGSGRQRITSGFVEEFISYFKVHAIDLEYVAQFKMFKMTLDLKKCNLDVHRFKAVTEALKNFSQPAVPA